MSQGIKLFRFIKINHVIAKRNIDRIILSAPFFSSWRFISYFNPWNWFQKKDIKQGVNIRLAIEELGPIFVKFGQVLSTRHDLLPEDIIDELEKLVDSVPPFPGEQAKKIIEETYQKPVTELFKEFDIKPLASASIAQVHAATLHNGKKVVVKVLRPNVEKQIRRDLSLMYTVAKLTERFWPKGRRLRPREVVAEFERIIIDELDLVREAANASQLRRNFIDSNLLYIPEVYWEFAKPNIMVMERIDGIPISNIDELKRRGFDLKRLSEKGVEIFFTQVFRDSFFHADMHPGNIFVAKKNPKDPEYMGVDFGIMGTLSPMDQRYLAENLVAFFKRDYKRIAILHVESGWVDKTTRIDQFESAIRAVCEPIFEKPLKDISLGKLLIRLFQTAEKFNMQIQPQLLLLQKTLLNIEGLGRQLYPELDLWNTAKPFLEKWLRHQMGLKALLKKAYKRGPYWAERLVEMPDLVYEVMQKVKSEKLIDESLFKKPRKTRRRFFLGIGLALVAATILNFVLFKSLTHAQITTTWLMGSLGIISLLFSSTETAK